MTDRYSEDIKRIVGIDTTQSELDIARQKGSLLGTRGIAFFEPDTNGIQIRSGKWELDKTTNIISFVTDNESTTESGKVKSGDVDPGKQNVAPSKDDADTISGNGGNGIKIGGGRNIDGSTYLDGQGSYDPEDIIDQTGNFPTIPDGQKSGIGQYDNPTGGTLLALEGIVDCDTGKEIDLRLDGLFVPPPNWAGPNDPGGHQEAFEPGTRWFWQGQTNAVNDTTPYLVGAEKSDDVWGAIYATAFLNVTVSSVPGQYTANYDRDILDTVSPALPDTHEITSESCTIDVDDNCPAFLDESDVMWPVDDKMQLVFGGGVFLINGNEPAADTVSKYTDGLHSQVDFCFGTSFGRTGTLKPTRTGGFALYETSGGNPTGIVTIFDSAGEVSEFTDTIRLPGFLP